MSFKRSKAIVLLSGGLDSQVSMALAATRFELVQAITCDYGQQAVRQEIAAARQFADYYHCPHRVISLAFLADVLQSALTQSTPASLPQFEPGELADSARCRDTAKAVWVPNRNGLFLNIAAAIAEKEGADWIICGFNKEEAATFPDNSQEFIDMANLFFHFSTANSVRVWSGTIDFDKTQIVQSALDRQIPLDFFWSCYRGDSDKMCGRCESCARAIRALKAAGVLERYGGRFLDEEDLADFILAQKLGIATDVPKAISVSRKSKNVPLSTLKK